MLDPSPLDPAQLDSLLAVDGAAEADPTTERILDAALAEFLSFGLRKSTVEDITRRARVGRMTVHRRFPSKQALIEAVFLREIRRVLADAGAVIAEHETLVDKLVEGLAFGLRGVYEHPLFSRLLETDREAMLPYLTVDAGALMVASTQFVERQIVAAGPAPHGAPPADYAAEAILRFCHSVLLTPRGRFDLRDDDELRAVLRAAVEPLVGAAGDTVMPGDARRS